MRDYLAYQNRAVPFYKRSRICGMPRWLAIVVAIILLVGVLFLVIPLPILLTTVWKKSDSGSGSDTDRQTVDTVRAEWVDADTPQDKWTKVMEDGSEYQLVFSDEFNQDGRSFHPGQDKIWEAVNLHYWQTGDYEHYIPEQVTTKDGTMQIKIEEKPYGGQNYSSGMVQTWNKFCFRGGYLEARVSLPGESTVPALWPAVWTMGNLGRAGYGASTDGLWPYSYDTCDVGVTVNQSDPTLSWLPGQRLNKCLCSDQDTPSPGVGRGSAEIDLIEGAGKDSGNDGGGTIAQSHQFAPFDAGYEVRNEFVPIYNASSTYMNSYKGAQLQQAVSAKTKVDPQYYEGKEYMVYAFDYTPGAAGKVSWWMDGQKRWSLDAQAVAPNPKSNVAQRLITEEPMYIIMNVGMSEGFSPVDLTLAKFPATMYIDYIRIYQHPDRVDVTCDPKDRPTAQYIKDHPRLYNDPTLKKFSEAGYPWPDYRIPAQCSA